MGPPPKPPPIVSLDSRIRALASNAPLQAPVRATRPLWGVRLRESLTSDSGAALGAV